MNFLSKIIPSNNPPCDQISPRSFHLRKEKKKSYKQIRPCWFFFSFLLLPQNVLFFSPHTQNLPPPKNKIKNKKKSFPLTLITNPHKNTTTAPQTPPPPPTIRYNAASKVPQTGLGHPSPKYTLPRVWSSLWPSQIKHDPHLLELPVVSLRPTHVHLPVPFVPQESL